MAGRSAARNVTPAVGETAAGATAQPAAAAPAAAAAKPKPAPAGGGGGRMSSPVLDTASEGAGLLLALLAWTWVGLPLLTGGPNTVKDVLRAKFFNKAKDGSWLP